MLRLITFGGLALQSDETVLKNHTPRQRLLPMLALLAADDGPGIPRERMAALIWPDSETSHARRSLEVAVSQARSLGRIAGCDDLFVGMSALKLDRTKMTADLWEFDAAVRSNELERALTISGGRRFADVPVDENPELEQRLGTIGERYEREQRALLARLASRAAGLGNLAGVVRHAGRILDTDPADRAATRLLIDALDAQHETARALVVADRHVEALRSIGVTPDAELAARIERLRGAPAAARGGEPTVTSQDRTGRPTPESHEQAERARVDGAIARRWRLAGPGERRSFITSYPASAIDDARSRVEVHVIRPVVAQHADAGRFVAILRRAAGLDHPHVLPVLDCDARDGVLYFATPPRAPASLASRIATARALPVPEAVRIGRALAGALAHAHGQGIVHGDLRPKQIHLPSPGHPVAAFFGVVDAIAAEPRAGDDDGSYVISFGERAYQSPEQVHRTVATSPSSDVYAFGAIVYEMLAGERPFAAPGTSPGTSLDLGRKLNQAPADLRSRRESVPPALEQIVLTCLSRVPADRYASGAELAEAMAALPL